MDMDGGGLYKKRRGKENKGEKKEEKEKII
jgi:hypothetical protein